MMAFGTSKKIIVAGHYHADLPFRANRKDPGRDQRKDIPDVDNIGFESVQRLAKLSNGLAGIEGANRSREPAFEVLRKVLAVASELLYRYAVAANKPHVVGRSVQGSVAAAVIVICVKNSHERRSFSRFSRRPLVKEVE